MLVEKEVSQLPVTRKTVDVDVGVKSLAVRSDGVVCDNPKYTKKYETKLAKEQSKLSKVVVQYWLPMFFAEYKVHSKEQHALEMELNYNEF